MSENIGCLFGQPRQEDLVKFLKENLEDEQIIQEIVKYKIDLSPK